MSSKASAKTASAEMDPRHAGIDASHACKHACGLLPTLSTLFTLFLCVYIYADEWIG